MRRREFIAGPGGAGADPPGGDRAACSDWATTDSS
jgi:hypothetical protein